MHDTSQKKRDLDFSDEERRVLAGVLDEIIPPRDDAAVPGAGELGMAAHIEGAVAETPDLKLAIGPGLAAVEGLARNRGASSFTALSKRDRVEVLGEVESAQPAFIPTLIFHACVGYYLNPRVLAAYGLPHRPPHPDGYEMEENDLTQLDAVRGRPKMYRDV